jgi:hypothetical protein
VTSGDAVYRPGSNDDARKLVPYVQATAAALDLGLADFDTLAVAGHLAGLLRQSALVESAGTADRSELAPVFEP